MDLVMINQLPELAVPRHRLIRPANNMPTQQNSRRNPYLSKWYAIFDNSIEQWISFQPRIGRTAYPCYACRDMFANRSSFLDHVNRRGLVLKYFCSHCQQYMTFFNTCSFLIHARTHFTDVGGSIDLDNIDITTISMDIAGFLPHPDYPRLYDVQEGKPLYNLNINVKFYQPKEDCIGTSVVFFIPNELVFYCNVRGENGVDETQSMILCQVCTDIPKCEFISINAQKNKTMPQNNNNNITKPVNKNKIAPNSIVNVRKSPESPNIQENSSVGIRLASNNAMEFDDSDDCIWIANDDDDGVICLDDDSIQSSEEVSVPRIKEEPIDIPKIQVKNLKLLINPNTLSPSSSEDETSIEKKPVLINKSPQISTKISTLPHCQECGKRQNSPMKDHFQDNDRPNHDEIKCSECSLLLPSPCSLSAHIRIHNKVEPFVCPECGKDFDNWETLYTHMEDVCFHLAKNIRYKCPAKKCGKIFAQTVTFSTHLPLQHIAIRYTCDVCAETFVSEPEFGLHAKIHTFSGYKEALPVTSYECLICGEQFDDVQDHVKIHCLDCENRIYAYSCKHCKSHYRSKNTYAAHLLRCTKSSGTSSTATKKDGGIESHNDMQCKVVRFCKNCNSKMQFHCTYKDIKTIGKRCPKCGLAFSYNKSKISNSENESDSEENICVLCKKPHEKHECKFQNPVVILNKNSTSDLSRKSDSSPDSSPSSEDGVKRKRRRFTLTKNKKMAIVDETYDIPPVNPILFDGEYICRLCDFKTESRVEFHVHIQEHRDVSTAYQCMECGECFVVKPSLVKHLQVFHLIENIETYINENECFDKEAVRALEENMRMIPGETKEPVAENQCRICRQLFPDGQELSKHFRTHGMAFLMKKIIPSK